MHRGSCTIEGEPRAQIPAIAELWQSFYRACVHAALLPPERVWLCCEDFIYSSENIYGGESSMQSTAIIYGIEGYRMGRADEWREHRRGPLHVPPMIMQTASQAKGFATNKRLKEWDCWVVGREHERSAMQHLAYFVKHYQVLGKV